MLSADVSEIVSQSGSPWLVQLLIRSLQSAQQVEDVTSVPSLHLPRRAIILQAKTSPMLRIEDQVLTWFLKNHFEGDRDRRNLHGYPGLFRKLREIPPWVDDITMDEHFGELSEERARELRPLYMYCLEHGEKLLEICQEHLIRRTEESPLLSGFLERDKVGLQGLKERGGLSESERLLLQDQLDALDKGLSTTDFHLLRDLERTIKLARLLGSEAIESLYKAIIPGYDEFNVFNGIPDLFIWHPDPAYDLWFFAEVKGRGDRLRESQSGWMQGFWEHVRGRILILHVS